MIVKFKGLSFQKQIQIIWGLDELYTKAEINPLEFILYFLRQKGTNSLQNYLKN